MSIYINEKKELIGNHIISCKRSVLYISGRYNALETDSKVVLRFYVLSCHEMYKKVNKEVFISCLSFEFERNTE